MTQAVFMDPRIGPYRLLHERGEGAFARAYLAEHPADGRLVVVKVAHTWNPLVEAAFRQEFLLGSRLRHPHLGEVLDHGRNEAGRPYLVLAFDDGESLDGRRGPWAEPELARLGVQLARGLGALHAQGLVHRDVAPGNVLVGPTGLARLIDFGLLTPAGAAGAAAGTPLYLAPEALADGTIDARSDLYALGALLYRQACGQAPFEELAADLLVDAVLHQAPRPIGQRAPQLSPAVAALIMRCLAKEPDDRPADAKEVAEALARALEGPALPLAEGTWHAPDAWTAWEVHAAAPGVYALTAPAGGGLSRALQEALRQVRRLDLPALAVAAEETTGPYGLVEAIARWAAALAPQALDGLEEDVRGALATLWPWAAPDGHGEAVDPGAEALANAVAGALTALLAGVAEGGRVAVMIDHWEQADPASQALLRKGWGGELAFCHWLLASREAVPEAVASWAIAPMPEAVMRPWLVSCLHGREPKGLTGRLWQLSGGNPGWAYQALQALHQSGQVADMPGGTGPLIGLPPSVEATLELQFNQLSLDERSLAEVLALYATPFSLDDLAPFSELLPAGWPLELPVLVSRGLLELRGGTYRWATGWWVGWVQGAIPPQRAGRLAWDLARALERHWFNGDGPRSAGLLHRLADLYDRSDDDEARLRFGLDAGLACAGVYANDAALAHFGQGLAAVERLGLGGPQRLGLASGRADVLRIMGALPEAIEAYIGCLDLTDDAPTRANLLVSLGKCQQMRNQFELATELLGQALALVPDASHPRERLRALTTLARVDYMAGRREACMQRYEEALDLARAASERDFLAESLSFLGQQLAGQAATAEIGQSYLEEALRLREALRDQMGRNDTHMLLGNAYLDRGRPRAALEHFEANRAIAAKVGHRGELAFAHVNLALCELELGRYAEALANARRAAELGESMGDDFLVGLGGFVASQAALQLGDLATVDEQLAVARERERRLNSPDLRLFGLLYEAERHLFMGRFGAAARAGELSQELVGQGVGVPLAPRAHLAVAEAWLHEGQLERVEAALRLARASVEETGSVAGQVGLLRLEGCLKLREGQPLAARAFWDEGLALAQDEGLRPLELRLLLASDLAAGQDLSRKPDASWLAKAYALSEGARMPEPLALACLGLAVHHLEDGKDLLAERLARRGQELIALYTQALPGSSDRQAFCGHPERAPYCAVREVEEAFRIQQRGRRLEMLLALAERLAASREPEGVLALVRDFTLEVTQAERCLVLLRRGSGELHVHGDEDAAYSQTLVARVIETRAAECVLDTRADEDLKAQRSIMDLRVRSVMCVPLLIGPTLHGVLYVDSRVALGTFTAEDLRVLEAIARQAAVALDNARMHALQRGLIRDREAQLERIQASDKVIGQLEELHRVRGQYFEAESHDLRAPLGSIRVAVQGLLKGLMGELAEEQREVLEGIGNAERFLATKIDDILDSARLEADKLALIPQAVPVARPIGQAIALVAAQARDKGLELSWQQPVGPLVVRADERRLVQLLLNLLSNAVKFTDAGQVEVLAALSGDMVEITVADTGPGIPLARQASLFERFGASTEIAGHSGSGLGLSWVKRLVELHEGAIDVESTPGAGTRVTVKLPRS